MPASGPQVCGSFVGSPFKIAHLTNHNGQVSLVAKDVSLGNYAQEPVSLLVTASVSGAVFSETIPGSSIVPKGRAFKYVASKKPAGIQRVVIKESRTPGLFQVTVKVKHGWPPGTIVEAPGSIFVQLRVGETCFFAHPTKLSR